MATKRIGLGLASVVAVAAVAAAFWWATRPTPYEAAYAAIPLGAKEQTVDELMGDPALKEGTGDLVGRFVSVRWERLHHGQPYRVYFTEEGRLEDDPVFQASGEELDRLDQRFTGDRSEEYVDEAGRVAFKVRCWVRDPNSLMVTYDADLRVIEKTLWTRPSASSMMERLRHAIDPWLRLGLP